MKQECMVCPGWKSVASRQGNRFEGRGKAIIPKPSLHAAGAKFDGLSVVSRDYPEYENSWGQRQKLTIPKQEIEMNQGKFQSESVYVKEYKQYKDVERRKPYIQHPTMHAASAKFDEKSVTSIHFQEYDDVWSKRLLPTIPPTNLHANNAKFNGNSVYSLDFQ